MGESVQCPNCGREYPLNATLLGRIVQCRTCGQAFRINPVVEAESTKPEVASPPKSRVAPPERPVSPQPLRDKPADDPPPDKRRQSSEDEDDEEEEDDETSVAVPAIVYEDISALQSNWEVAVRKLNFRSPEDVANFLVGHKLMLAVISVAFLSLILFTQVSEGLYGLVLFVMGLALTPFGLLPMPQANESRSGFYFAFVAVIWMALGLLMRAMGGRLLPPMEGMSAPMVLGVFAMLIVGILAVTGGIVAISLLFRRFGFFRTGAWLYMIGLVLLPLIWRSCPQSLKDQVSFQAIVQSAFGAGSAGAGWGPAGHPLANDPQMLRLVERHGLNRVVTLELDGLAADKAEGILSHLRTNTKCDGFVGPPVDNRPTVVVAPWGQPKTLADKIDFGTVTNIDSERRILSIKTDLSKLEPPAAPKAVAAAAAPAAGEANAPAAPAPPAPQASPPETAQALLELLNTTEGPNRIAILDTLDVVGGDSMTPTFIDLLKDKDPEFRKKVLDILARRGDPRAILPMVRLLAEANSGVEEALVRMGPAAELGILDLLGELDEAAGVRACQVLGRIGSDRSLPALKQLAGKNNTALSSAATEAIQAIARRASGSAPMPRPTPKSEKPSAPVKPPASPSETPPAPAKPPESSKPDRPMLAADKESLDTALAALRLDDAQRKVAGEQLRQIPPDKARAKQVGDALVRALGETRDADARASLIHALAAWYTPETLPVLLEGLRDENLFVRHKTIEALGTLRDEQAIRALADCLGDANLSVPATRALVAMGPTAEKTVLKYAEHPDRQVRLQAVRVLGQIGTERALPSLSRLSRVGDPMLRWAIDDAIQSIRYRRSDPNAPTETKPSDLKDLNPPDGRKVE
jgi:HEAT repeat protein